MNAISLYNPHATLVAIGAKKFETRAWRPARVSNERVAIAATMRSPADFKALIGVDAFQKALGENDLIDGAILCTVAIVDVVSTLMWIRTHCRQMLKGEFENEYLFGDYSPGRYAWQLSDVRRLRIPIPFVGGQRWRTVSPEVEEHINELERTA